MLGTFSAAGFSAGAGEGGEGGEGGRVRGVVCGDDDDDDDDEGGQDEGFEDDFSGTDLDSSGLMFELEM